MSYGCCLVLSLGVVISTPTRADDAVAVARSVLGATEIVLAHHPEPPTRQEMIARAVRNLFPDGLSSARAAVAEQVSALSNPAEIEAFLVRQCEKRLREGMSKYDLSERLVRGVSASVDGGLAVLSPDEVDARQRFETNRFVGTGLVLERRELDAAAKAKLGGTFAPMVRWAWPGSPAEREQLAEGDLLVAVEGQRTVDTSLAVAAAALRGPEGTTVSFELWSPTYGFSRTVSVTRAPIYFDNLQGFTVIGDGPDAVAYLQVVRLFGGVVKELEQYEQQLLERGVRTLMLDLREAQSDLVSTIEFADALLDEGPIGGVRERRNRTSYRTHPGKRLESVRLALIVDGSTHGFAEWVTAALQDRGRAVVMGPTPTGARAEYYLSVPLDGVPGSEVLLCTGTFERGDGRALRGSGVRPDLEIAPTASNEEIANVLRAFK